MALTEGEVQTQWQNVVDLLETTRAYLDGTVAPSGGLLDVLLQSLEGNYTPESLAAAAGNYRGLCSALVDPGIASQFLTPILYEYAPLITDFGGGYTNAGDIMRALYEWFHTNSYSVESRAITYDSSATAGGGNVGNGAMSRLTTDQYGYNLEACTVEQKIFRCRKDQNTGAHAGDEVFESLGTAPSRDALLRASYGSGTTGRVLIRSHNAGTGPGGSLLRNSSFTSYSATATPQFTGWTETTGGANVSQDTTNYYRSFPNAGTDASLKITGGGGQVTLTQTLADMRINAIDPERPYFFRAMVNKTIGSGSGGTLTFTVGSQTIVTAISGLGSGWQEILLPIGTGCWPRIFNADPFTVAIDWDGTSAGYLLIDDILFAPWDLIDGTYWFLRGNAATHTDWLLDDTLTFTDTGGAPATGKIQWWLWLAGLGYLPSSGSPTLADPI